jgi:CBS domain-containing protein
VRYEYAFSAYAQRGMEASTLMIRIPQDTTLGAAARQMRLENAAVALVVDREDLPIGVLTERQLVAAMAAGRHPDVGTAGAWMVPVIIDANGARGLPDTDATTRVGIAARGRAQA